MKPDPILEELWRIKDKLSREMAADPAAYLSKLDQITSAEVANGRKIIHSFHELRQFADEQERQRAQPSSMILNDKSSK